jgi:GNAT superfamily N-acetyltransferase
MAIALSRQAPRYRVAAARPNDLSQLPAIELAASRLFDGYGLDDVPFQPTGQDGLRQAQHDGRLWVVLTHEAPVGFALVEVIEPGSAHLEELDVHPDHGRRGLGTRLVTHVSHWATTGGYRSVTLTTFRDIPWNMPFYARLGFEVLPGEALSPALRAVVEHERRRGLDPARRVVMRQLCAGNGMP